MNSSTFWEWTWLIDEKKVGIETVDCIEMVNSWTDVPKGERDSIIDELQASTISITNWLPSRGNTLLCPNLTSFDVHGGQFPTSSLSLSLERTEAGKAYPGVHTVY